MIPFHNILAGGQG
ncbi:hypothetical protein YPPY48_2102, partial [Yersinia pestis PY-48]